jgi:hypothetical protein
MTIIAIPNFLTVTVLTLPHSPYMTFVDFAHLSIDYVNSSSNYGNTSID